jgi:GTP-binding protein
VSRAKPKIADYPFTTLVPHLGVVGLPGNRSFVLADIPGLIEGAADGHGLGHRFLKHVERARVLLHLLELNEGEGRSPMGDYDVINRELERFDPELRKRPQVVALGKMDLTETREAYPALKDAFLARGVHLHALSSASRHGLPEILESLWKVAKGTAP